MEKINGIVYHGKFYLAMPRHIADIFEEKVNGVLRYTQISTRMVDGKLVEDVRRYRFRYSAELTERLKGGEKPKRMCLRDKSKVCDLCHECDIDVSQPRY